MALTEVDVSRLNDNVFNTTGPFTNRIINGDMRIDQRNAGAAVTPGNGATTYLCDRWRVYKANNSLALTSQRSTTAPSTFTNSLLFSITTGSSPGASDELSVAQIIEGFNIADLGWGTASAQSITLSFWVRSSITGTYAFGLINNGAGRSYIGTYTVNSANTFEYKTITVAGDTSGTWLADNGAGLIVVFDLGSGSNFQGTAGTWGTGNKYATSGSVKLAATTGATFYITGVQLEAGTVATPFERRSYGQELALCQRYCYRWKYPHRDAIFLFIREANLTTFYGPPINFPVVMRQINSVTFLDSSTWNVVSGAVQTITPGAQFNSSVTEVSSFHLYFTWSGSSGSWDIANIRSNQNTPSLLPKIIVDGEL